MDKTKISKLGLSLMGLLLGGIIGWLVELSPAAQAGQLASQVLITPTVSLTVTPAKTTTPAASPGPTPTIAWSESPVCENLPQDLNAWLLYTQNSLTDPTIVAQLSRYLREAKRLDPTFQNLDFNGLLALLHAPETAETSQVILRELTVLWLNILSGRLSQATELEMATQPEIKTVADLIAQLEQSLATGDLPATLLEASRQLQTGQNISRAVCGRLIYRTGSVIRESLWSANGYLERDTPIPNVPVGLSSFSPDYSKLIVETAARDTGGGPLYLFDLKTGDLLNLNQRLGLPDYPGPLGLTIGGWNPDSNRFLILDRNDDKVIWADLKANIFQRISLNQEQGVAPIKHITLSPDGNSIIYVADDVNHKASFRRYDFQSQTVTTLTTLDIDSHQLASFRLSPGGEMAAIVIKKGQRQTGLSYALELLNLTTYARTPLIEGNLGRTEPIWSPDGQKIAFIRKTQDTPDVARADQHQPWQGNIWLASISSGQVQQITFVDGAAHRPIWSSDSRFLAFVTHNGQIGLVAVDQPGLVWQLGTSLNLPELTSLNLLP